MPVIFRLRRNYGLRTGFIYRPKEFGNGTLSVPDKAAPGDFDVVSVSAIDLAQQMGANRESSYSPSPGPLALPDGAPLDALHIIRSLLIRYLTELHPDWAVRRVPGQIDDHFSKHS